MEDINKQEGVKARVLSAGIYGQPNEIVTLSADEAELAQKGGLVDTTPEAVAYAESIAVATVGE